MRHISLLILFIIISISGIAKCGVRGIYLLTKTSTLNKNGIIILEFQASSQLLIENLNNKYPIYLKAGKEKVTLLPTEIFKGEFELTEVVFKPSSELRENQVYKLCIDKLPKHEREFAEFHRNSPNQAIGAEFLISSIDNQSPRFDSFPVETRKYMDVPACGPVRWVYFRLSVQDSSETYVLATVKNLNTLLETKYILKIDSREIAVGHGMCQGAFHFDNGVNFEISFVLIDQSGNRSEGTKAIAFQKPMNMDKYLRGKQNGS